MKAVTYWYIWLGIFIAEFISLWVIADNYNSEHTIVALVALIIINKELVKLAHTYNIVDNVSCSSDMRGNAVCVPTKEDYNKVCKPTIDQDKL